jgi:hypothetical protein
VRIRRALAVAAWLTGWAMLGPARAAAQIFPAQPGRYELTTEATDARALWVNPAGLARLPEASVGADLTADRFFPGGAQVSQYSLSLAGRGVAASWLHERLPSSQSLNVYAVGIGLGDEQFSAGVTRRWFRGLATGGAWDIAARVSMRDATQLSLVARNVGSPRLADSTYWATLVPGALVYLLRGGVQLGAEWEVAPHAWRSIGYRAGGSVVLGKGFALSLLADLGPGFKRRALALALSFDAPRSRLGAFGLASGGASEVDAVGVSGALVTRAPTPRR